ncbi:protein PRR14L [Emydura macquarii macquarii]|uniref:protein PRR14L n=1 Tax=Emydura macquarii macquarii TaxID=1129001 RepID=UPI00352B23E1
MLSSGVESQERSHSHPLDSSMSAVVQELYTGLPVSISTELIAGSEPNVRLDTKTEAPILVLAHTRNLLSEHHRFCRVENCSQETDKLDHGDKLTSHGLAESLSEECVGVGNLAEDEEVKSGSLGKQNSCADGYQKEKIESAKETQDAEEELVGCCALASEEKWWLRQEEPQINQNGREVSRICCTEMASPLKSKEENQTNVQVTPEILPKPTEEVQGMKADGTRIFSKAGHRNDRVSKGLPPESNECPDVDTIMASGEVSETNTLVPLEPLTVVDTGSTKEYPQEEKEYKRLTACTTMSLTARGCAIFDSKTGEVKLSRSSFINTAPACYQTYKQDEENSPHNYSAVPVSRSSVEVDMPFTKESSEALCGPLRCLYSQDPENMPLENNTTEICEIQEEYLVEERESPSCDGDCRKIEFLENWISRPVMKEPLSPVQSEEMSSYEAEQSEMGSCTDHSHSSGYGKVAEIQKETAMKDSCGMDSGHAIQESIHSESSNLPVPTFVASSTEAFPKGDLRIPSEVNLNKDEDQWQICIYDVCSCDVVKQHAKENGTVLVDTKNLVSIETGNVHTCSDMYNKYANSPPTLHDFLDYGTKLDEVSLEAQRFGKETNSSSVVEDLDNSFGKAPKVNSVNVNLPTCKETNFAYIRGEAVGHEAEKTRVSLGVLSELSSCSADAVSNRDVYLDRPSKHESITASAKLEAQSAGLLLHKNEESSLANHSSFSTSNVASKGFQKSMHSALEDTEYVVTDVENEQSDTCAQNDQCIKDHCSAVKTSFILSDSTSLDNSTLNKDSFEVQAELMTEEVNGLETGDILVPADKKTVNFPEANTRVAREIVPCEDSWDCSNMFQYMTNSTSTVDNPLGSACIADESTTRLSEMEISDTNIKVESWKLYDGHCEITEERLDSGTREITSDTDKGQEQINSCALQKDEIDRIETVDSIKAHEGSHQNETSEQSVNRDLNKLIFGIHLELCNSTVGLGEREGEVEIHRKKTVLPCEYNPSEGTTSKSDTDSSIPSHIKHLDPSLDLKPSCFKHSKQPNETICQVENQYLAFQSEFNGPVSYKQNETPVADEVLEFQQYNLDISNKQISNTGVQTMTSSVEEPKRYIRSNENEQLTLKKNEDVVPLVHESLREKSFQGTFKEIMGRGRVELKESDNVGSSAKEDQTTFKESMVGYSSSNSLVNAEYTDSVSSAKEDQREECTMFAENTKLSALLNVGSFVIVPEHKIKTIVESFSVSQSASKSLSHEPEDMTLIPEIRNETCLLLDSAVNHRIIEKNKVCPQPELVTFTVADSLESVNPVQSEKFCVNQGFSSLKEVTSETPLAQNSKICLPLKDKLPAPSENTQIIDHDTANALCNDCSATEPLELTVSFERRADDNDSPSEEREKATGSLNNAVKLEVFMASHAHIKERSVSAGDGEPTVKEMDVNSSDIDSVQKFKRVSVEDHRESAVTGEKIKMPMHSIFDNKNYVGVLLEGLKFSGDKVRSCVPLKVESYEKPSQGYSSEQIPECSLHNLSDKGKTYIKDPSESGDVKLLSEIISNYLQSKDLINKETSEVHYNTIGINKLSNDTEASLKYLDCGEVCPPYEFSSQSKDSSKEVIGDQIKTPCDSICAENEVSDTERLDKVGECQTLKQKICEETEVHPTQNILLCEGQAQQIQESKYQERTNIPLQECVVFDPEPLESSSDELVTSSRVMKTEGPREQVFAIMSNINDSENKQMYSTLQEVKRPKISKDDDSSHSWTMDSEVESLNFHLGTHIECSANTGFIPISFSLPQANSFAGRDEIPDAFGNTHKLSGLFSSRKQPGRKCKRVPTPDQLKTVRKSNKVKSSVFLRNSPETLPTQEHKLLNSVYFACKPPAMETERAMKLDYMSKQRPNRCSLLNSLKLSKYTKEPTLLSRLSTMANKLMAPPKSIHRVKTLQCSPELLPVVKRFSQLRSKKLLEVFSCINMKLNQTDGLCTKMFNFQPLALYPVDSTKIHILDLSSNIPSSIFNTPISPISFHTKLDSDSLINLTRITSQHSVVPDRPALGEASIYTSQPSEWTFSFLLSQSCSRTAAFREDPNISTELHSSDLSLTTTEAVTPSYDYRKNPLAKRRAAGCSVLGLHTVLALSSPGCYRIWTRRRNVTSQIPTVQRLFMSQFTQGLKGIRSPTSVSHDLFSSLPYSLGRVLSIWSQHGPSACPSEFTPLHSNHCKWQPSLGIENSYAILPYMTVQGTEAARTTVAEIRLEPSLSDLLPKSCTFPESAVSPLRFSVSELQVHPFDELAASLPVYPKSQSTTELKKAEPEKRPKRVSQIRIRKTVPKPDPNLTPMGLPRPKRLKKKEFSLEEIYTNKNYKSPPTTRCLETIFEEPKEKNGSLISISQQKRKRILEFQDFTIPRKRKARSRIKVAGSFTRAKKAALQGRELDALLIQKLMDLEAFFAEEEEQEQASIS